MNQHYQLPPRFPCVGRLGLATLIGTLLPGTIGLSSIAVAQDSLPLAAPTAPPVLPESLAAAAPPAMLPGSATQIAPASPTAEPVLPRSLFVDVQTGHDRQGNGSQAAPYRTLTQALQVASAGTVILLAPGVYNQAQGEIFPLQLPSEVTIQGNPTPSEAVILQGGGPLQVGGEVVNVTLLGADRAALVGVTVTNPNPQGHAIWIGDSSPTIVDSVITGNEATGITIAGQSHPLIQNNQLQHNGAGIHVAAIAHPRLRGNLLQDNHIGILVTDQARPQITHTELRQNHDGLVVLDAAQPIVRQSLFTEQVRDGLVVTGEALPDLGTEREAGNNQFQNNGRFDINAQATTAFIPAVGNQLSPDRSLGRIDQGGRITRRIPILAGQEAILAAGGAASPMAPLPSPPPAQAAAFAPRSQQEIALPVPPPTSSTPTALVPASPSVAAFPQPFLLATASSPASISALGTAAHFPTPTLTAGSVAPSRPPTRYAAPVMATAMSQWAASPASPRQPVAMQPVTVQPATIPPAAVTVPVVVARPPQPSPPVPMTQYPVPPTPIPPAGRSTATMPTGLGPNPLLSVPSTEIPVGTSDGNRAVWQPGASPATPQATPTPTAPVVTPQPQAAPAPNPQAPYRVVVQVANPQEQARLQSVLPDTLQAPIPGRPLMQVGTFGDRNRAVQFQKALQRQGLQVFVEQW